MVQRCISGLSISGISGFGPEAGVTDAPTFAAVFKKLQQKWGVGPGRLFLILCTFALGGSLCGRAGKWLLDQSGIENLWLYIPLYIVLVTLLWPLCVLLVSFPFGQWAFFTRYLRRMGNRMRGRG